MGSLSQLPKMAKPRMLGAGGRRGTSVSPPGVGVGSAVCPEKPWAELGALHPGVFRDPAV